MASNRPGELSRPQSAAGASLPSPTPSRADSSSSKTSSPSDSIDFRFLNFAHPKDAKNAQTRRSVRSHVTSRQHQNQRRAAAEQAQRSQSSASAATAAPSVAWSSSVDSPDTETSSPEPASPTLSYSASASPALSPHNIVRLNPLDVYPGEWHAHLRPIMDHYLNSMSIDVPETDATTREVIRTRYLALVLTDAAPLHALMLAAAAHYAKLYGPQIHQINILQLRGMAYQEINQALTDARPGGRATSDQLIAAIAKIATYELLFGARETFTTHMLGLIRIVALRGGLANLGLDGFLERALLWLDSNAAAITSKPLFFQPAQFPSTKGHPRPDQRLFLLGVRAGAQ